MLGKAQAKLVKMLQQKKQRKKEGLFVAEGEKIVKEALRSNFEVHQVFATGNWLQKQGFLEAGSGNFQEVDEKDLKGISSLNTPQEVLAVLEIPKATTGNINTQSQLVLALDRVKDPGNMGTIIRIADWFGIPNIVCSTDCVDVYNPKVVQATMGSLFRIGIHYINIENWLEKQECTIYGAVLDGENLWGQQLRTTGILLMGNESVGISDELMKFVHQPLSIPALGKAESLNVAVATAIFCAEFAKLRQTN